MARASLVARGDALQRPSVLAPCLAVAMLCYIGTCVLDATRGIDVNRDPPMDPSAFVLANDHLGESARLRRASRAGGDARSRTSRRFFGQLLGLETPGDVKDLPVKETPTTPLPAGPYAPEGFDSVDMEMPVLRYPHPALRRQNERVEEFDGRLKRLADNLFRSMYADRGRGLAAPQVGVNLRVMVYNPDPSTKDGETVFVNPQIIEVSGQTDVETEACLSFPRMQGSVRRPVWIRVQASDWDGCPFERRITDFEARVFQHEYDHLEGIVYIDRLADSWKAALGPDLNFLIKDYGQLGGTDPAL